jgi:hypothetical protein
MNVGIAGRIFAACIAATAWLGLLIQLSVSYSQMASVAIALWEMLAYFTITTNLLVAVVFTCVAIDRTALRADWVLGGTMLSIVLVGVVYALLLRGTLELSGGSALVDKLVHMVVPVLVPLFWIFFAHKGGLTWRDPLLWAIYPLAYLAYGMTRGALTGKYAYPFLDALGLGWQRTALNAFLIAASFMAAGFATVWLDHRLARS